MKIRSFCKREDGQVLVLFALLFLVLCFFVGLGIDLSLLYKQRSAMQTALQTVRDNRFTYQDSVRYAENPAAELYKIASNTLADNGCDDQTGLKVYFKEETPQQHYRYFTVRTEITQEYRWVFLNLFGPDTSMVTVYLDGGESYGDGVIENVWHPNHSPSAYNGCYEGVVGESYTAHTSDLPEDW